MKQIRQLIGSEKTAPCVLLSILFLLIILADTFFWAYATDAAVFEYVGRVTANGGIPYIDAWDHKGAVVYLYSTAGAFISQGTGTCVGPMLLGVSAAISTLLVLYKTLAKFTCSSVSALMTVFASYCVVLFHRNLGWNVPICIYISLCVLSLFCLEKIIKGKTAYCLVLATGFIFGLCFMTKGNYVGVGVFSLTVFAIDAMCNKKYKVNLARTAVYVLGCICSIGGMLLLFHAMGAFHEILDASFAFNIFEYKSDVSVFQSFSTTRLIPDCVKGSFILQLLYAESMNLFAFCREFPSWALMWVLSLFVTVCYGVKKSGKIVYMPVMLSAWLWLIIEMATCNIKCQTYAHYYTALSIPTAIIVGHAVFCLKQKIDVRIISLVVGLYLLCSIVHIFDNSRTENPYYGIDTIPPEAAAIGEQINPERRNVVTFGGIFACRYMNKSGVFAENRYCINRYVYAASASDKRKQDVQRDFLRAFDNNASGLLISEVPLEELPLETEELERLLNSCEKVYGDGRLYLYKIKR